jgi:hypothetical protein
VPGGTIELIHINRWGLQRGNSQFFIRRIISEVFSNRFRYEDRPPWPVALLFLSISPQVK